MKYVETNPYHAWAHQSRDHGRNSGHTRSFEGAYAYSYRACIGQIVTNEAGTKAYYVNTHSYSVTTAKHQSELRHAIPSYAQIFRYDLNAHRSEESGRNWYLFHINDALGKAKRARTNKEWRLHEAQEWYTEYLAWCAFEGYAAPSSNAVLDSDAIQAQIAEAEAQALKAAIERGRQVRIENADKVTRWHNGESVYVPYECGYLLRVEGDMVKTSQGATVPLSEVLPMVPVVLRAIREGSTLPARGRLGAYPFGGVDAEGTVHIGCHAILKGEVERFALSIGIN